MCTQAMQRHFAQNCAGTWWVTEHEASGQCQFVICNTFVLVKGASENTHWWIIPPIIFFVAVVTKQLVSFLACWNHSSISKQTLHKSLGLNTSLHTLRYYVGNKITICIFSWQSRITNQKLKNWYTLNLSLSPSQPLLKWSSEETMLYSCFYYTLSY